MIEGKSSNRRALEERTRPVKNSAKKQMKQYSERMRESLSSLHSLVDYVFRDSRASSANSSVKKENY